MGLFGFLSGLFCDDDVAPLDQSTGIGDDDGSNTADNTVNPTTGLPMVGGTAGIDVQGNPYGIDSDFMDGADDFWPPCDDPFSSPFSDLSGTGIGDGFGTLMDDTFDIGGSLDDW